MTSIDVLYDECESPRLNVFWIYPPWGAHRAVMLDDGRAFYFTSKPSHNGVHSECVEIEQEDGFNRRSYLNVVEPLMRDEFQIETEPSVHSVLSKSASAYIESRIRRYYPDVCFI
jgi:hypothetical protein